MRHDEQAESFEKRTGLPEAVLFGIRPALSGIFRFRGLGSLLEVGVGTGSLGVRLRELPPHYLGFDLSWPMLRLARARLGAGRGGLFQADGCGSWPVAAGSVEMVFGSRALHLLGPAHVVSEAMRVGLPSGVALILGSVQRGPGSVKAILQREMRRLLRERGYEGPGGGKGKREILDLGLRAGGRPLPSVAVARWRTTHAPADSLAAWREKRGLDGLPVPEDVKAQVLGALEGWMRGRFADPARPQEDEETYVLDGVELRAAAWA